MIYNGKSQRTWKYTEQRFAQNIELGTVNGWRAVFLGNWGDEISVSGEDGGKILSAHIRSGNANDERPLYVIWFLQGWLRL